MFGISIIHLVALQMKLPSFRGYCPPQKVWILPPKSCRLPSTITTKNCFKRRSKKSSIRSWAVQTQLNTRIGIRMERKTTPVMDMVFSREQSSLAETVDMTQQTDISPIQFLMRNLRHRPPMRPKIYGQI